MRWNDSFESKYERYRAKRNNGLWCVDVCRTGNNGLWCVDVDRTGRVVKLQTGNNGVDTGRVQRRNGLDGTKVVIKRRKYRAKRNNELWCVDVCRTGIVCEVQTRNNGAERVTAMQRKGCDGTII